MGVLGDTGVIRHEETMPERVAAIRSSLSKRLHDPGPLWLWCDDTDDSLAAAIQPKGPPQIAVQDGLGCMHEYWRIETVRIPLSGRSLFLADGHHRYAAGWRFATIQIRNSSMRNRAVSDASVEQIERNARAGRLLPPKSTDFVPKLAAGVVIHFDQ
jgi:uncharacterized protein (DUF1015 family)